MQEPWSNVSFLFTYNTKMEQPNKFSKSSDQWVAVKREVSVCLLALRNDKANPNNGKTKVQAPELQSCFVELMFVLAVAAAAVVDVMLGQTLMAHLYTSLLFHQSAQLALSSDKISMLQMPLLNLDLDVRENGEIKPISIEMNKEELQNLINALEAANKVALIPSFVPDFLSTEFVLTEVVSSAWLAEKPKSVIHSLAKSLWSYRRPYRRQTVLDRLQGFLFFRTI